jgi:hypothetical protein
MRAAFFHSLAVLLALGSAAPGEVVWERWDVFANLDNEGTVVVTETMVARVNGGEAGLDRRLPAGTDQEIVIRKFVRVEGIEQQEVAGMVFRDGELTWGIRADSDPLWNNQLLTFRLEYELRGALAPAWDIPAGPGSFLYRKKFPHFWQRWGETFAAWREPLGRYRFDHDVAFARFSSEGPRELNYTFKYDTAWKHPQPKAELNARVTRESDYRVTELRDYLRPGSPPAVVLWKPAVRVGSILAFALLALGLWFVFALGEGRRRGWLRQRLDRAWFQQNIAAIPAEILAWRGSATSHVSAFPLLLARWRSRGLIEVREGPEVDEDGDAILHLRLLGDESRLPGYERAVLKKLFQKGREITPGELREIHAEEGFDPEEVLDDALAEHEEGQPASAPTPRPSLFWRILRGLMPLLFVASAVLILIEAFRSQYNDPLEDAMYLGGGFVVLGLAASLIAASRGALVAALALLVPILAAVPGLIALNFQHTLPLLPEGSVGLALLAFWFVAALLLIARAGETGVTPEQQLAALGQSFVRRELGRQRPNLDDAWLPQIIGLGCGPSVEGWRLRRTEASGAIAPPVLLPGTLPSPENFRPFTGNPAQMPEEDWAIELEVLSAEDRRELEDDEKEEEDEEDENPHAK